MAGDGEAVALEQVEDGDPPLLLDVGVAPQDRALVELDVDDAGIGHDGLLAGAAFSPATSTSANDSSTNRYTGLLACDGAADRVPDGSAKAHGSAIAISLVNRYRRRAGPVPAPECRGRGGAARRADDRQPAGRGHPAQAPAASISSSRCTGGSTSRSCACSTRTCRQPGHAAAAVRGGRGDEGAGRAGLSRPADRLGRGDHRRARFRRADLRPGPAPRAGRGRARDGRARARHLGGGRAQGRRSRTPRASSTGSPRKAAARARSRASREATRLAVEMAEKALNSRRRPCRASPPGSNGINAKIGGLHKSDLIILAGRPGMGKTALATNIAFAAAQRFVRDRRTASSRRRSAGARGRLLQPRNVGRPARHPHPRRAVGDQLREPAHGQDQPAGVPQPRPRRGRARDAAALHRRHAGPDHRRAAHPRAAAEAAEGHRPGRRRLSPAAPGHGQELATTIASRRFPRSAAA